MKIIVSVQLNIELDKDVSVEDSGLMSRITDDLFEEITYCDLDFQSEEDEDITVTVNKCRLMHIIPKIGDLGGV